MRFNTVPAVLTALFITIGCASTDEAPTPKPVKQLPAPEPSPLPTGGKIEGHFTPNSVFAKLKLDMTQNQVHDLLGKPSDTLKYRTGKQFIPGYREFGRDKARIDEFYKGVGVLTFINSGQDRYHWRLYIASYNPNEDGIADKKQMENNED